VRDITAWRPRTFLKYFVCGCSAYTQDEGQGRKRSREPAVRGVVPEGAPLPRTWCCHTPLWVKEPTGHSSRGGGPTYLWACTRCGNRTRWENGDRNQCFAKNGDKIPFHAIQEMTGTLQRD
jgi:hypothetical protein